MLQVCNFSIKKKSIVLIPVISSNRCWRCCYFGDYCLSNTAFNPLRSFIIIEILALALLLTTGFSKLQLFPCRPVFVDLLTLTILTLPDY